MDKVNQYLFYEFGSSLREAREMRAGQKLRQYAMPAAIARNALAKFLNESSHVPLKKSQVSARKLMELLDKFTYWGGVPPGLRGLKGPDIERELEEQEANKIQRALDDFEAVFSSEAQDLEVFSVPQKCAYSTTTLIDAGENVLPPSVRDFISNYAKEEMHEAGRCLAFTLPTAAGFHMVRALEAVVRNYWDVLSAGKPRPKYASGDDAAMGTFISEVEKEGADKKAIETLKQLTKLHRNPIAHPDAVLSEPEAIILLGVVTSAITVMVEEMKTKGLTAAPPS
jgi:hypothetical protein